MSELERGTGGGGSGCSYTVNAAGGYSGAGSLGTSYSGGSGGGGIRNTNRTVEANPAGEGRSWRRS